MPASIFDRYMVKSQPSRLVKREPGLKSEDHVDLSLAEGSIIVLQPVAIYPTVQLSDEGLIKLKEARESGVGEMPGWFA